MSATRVRYLLNQWRLRSLALSRLEDLAKEKGPAKPADPLSPPSPPEKEPKPQE